MAAVKVQIKQQDTAVAQHLETIKVETVSRINEKEVKSDEILAALTQTSETAIQEVRDHAADLENAIKYRVSDCETLVKSRITEEYVKNLGERIRLEIMGGVSSCCLSADNVFRIVRPQK